MKNHLALATILGVQISCGSGQEGQDVPKKSLADEVAEASALPQVSFEDEIMPIFKTRCAPCHFPGSPLEATMGHPLSYLNASDFTSRIGNSILPGDPDGSRLYPVITQEIKVGHKNPTVMPPPDAGDPWTVEEIKLLRTWILQGAKGVPGVE